MRLAEDPRVCLSALKELSSLLRETGCMNRPVAVEDQHLSSSHQGGADAADPSLPRPRTASPVRPASESTCVESTPDECSEDSNAGSGTDAKRVRGEGGGKRRGRGVQ